MSAPPSGAKRGAFGESLRLCAIRLAQPVQTILHQLDGDYGSTDANAQSEAKADGQFPIYTIETAPEASKPALWDLHEAFGVIPNIAGAMAI